MSLNSVHMSVMGVSQTHLDYLLRSIEKVLLETRIRVGRYCNPHSQDLEDATTFVSFRV